MAKEKKQDADFDTGKILAVLSYLGILCLVPLILKPKDEFVRQHAKQGLVLFIFELILLVINVIPLLGTLVFSLGMILAIILSLMGIINGLAGKKWKMPVLGKYADRLNF